MLQEIVMPQLGLTMTEGAVSAWMKKPGDKVERGEILFLVQTDKVEMEVESFVTGFVDSILVEPEIVVTVGTVIATVEDGRAAKAVPPPVNPLPATVPQPSPTQEILPERVITQSVTPISPRARKLADSLGIDVALLKPSKSARITEEDVRRFQEQSASKPSRAVVAQRMASSFQSAPHFYLTTHVDVSKLVELRTGNVAGLQEKHGVKITYTDFLLQALATALRENPDVNSFWGANEVEPWSAVDIALAVQTPSALVTPVIRGADGLSIAELAKRRVSLTEKARTRRLMPDEMSGGSATLTNLGAHQIDEFHPILNPPQSAILAAGRIAKRPLVVDDEIVARFTLHLTLAVDHRVLDGMRAAEFLDRIYDLVKNPDGASL
jgi:pyruvate dehydrogenase E2 component (dihydrolipoamide acetyltransferase)